MYTESAHTIIRDFRRTVEYDMELAILVFVTLRCNLCIATINVCNSEKEKYIAVSMCMYHVQKYIHNFRWSLKRAVRWTRVGGVKSA
jgi:hypothetical protein